MSHHGKYTRRCAICNSLLPQQRPLTLDRALETRRRVVCGACWRSPLAECAVDGGECGSVAAFRQSLAETIAWCTAHATTADPDRCLRTPALEPGQFDAKLSVKERQECVAHLVQTRSRLLHDAGLSALTPATDLAGGRLLLFDRPWDALGRRGAREFARVLWRLHVLPLGLLGAARCRSPHTSATGNRGCA